MTDGGMLSTVRADAQRHVGRPPKARDLVALAARDPAFRAVLTLRLCTAARRSRASGAPVARWIAHRLHRWTQRRAALFLPASVIAGPGLCIVHGFGIVVTPEARLGCDVTLFHGATIGQRDQILADGTRRRGYPVLGDDVWVGPHVVVAGDVTVGDGARLAPGALVLEDVEPRSLVGGNPARVLRRDVPPDVLNPSRRSP